jgi:Cdc6-like AAA superfamily ATPase
MFVRNFNGKLIKINTTVYNSEKQLYTDLWDKMFNIKDITFKDQTKEIIEYIKK